MKATLIPYLCFDGTTKQAMEFYHSVLGGELVMQTFAESGMPTKDKDKDKIYPCGFKKRVVFLYGQRR